MVLRWNFSPEVRPSTRRLNLDLLWNLEPSVARSVFLEMLEEAHVRVVVNASIRSVTWENLQSEYDRRLSTIVTDVGQFHGRYFVDASYEGDVVGVAGILHSIGRESKTTYNESALIHRLVMGVDHCFACPTRVDLEATQVVHTRT